MASICDYSVCYTNVTHSHPGIPPCPTHLKTCAGSWKKDCLRLALFFSSLLSCARLMLTIGEVIKVSESGSTSHYLWKVFCFPGAGISLCSSGWPYSSGLMQSLLLHLQWSPDYRQILSGSYEVFLPQIISPKPVKSLDLYSVDKNK